MRRPITRLAYWTGIRRWPSWMKTTAAITREREERHHDLEDLVGVRPPGLDAAAAGRETIEAKIISEMPLPMPRWVISSPIHMSSTQPAVRQMTIRKTRADVEVVDDRLRRRVAWNERKRKT